MGSFGGGLESVSIEFDPRSILQGIDRVNQDLEKLEGGSSKATDQLKSHWGGVVDLLTRVSDRSKNAADSYVRSLERQAAAVGKSGLDKLNAQMEQAIKNYGYSEQAINKITAAYHKMAEAQERGTQGFGAGTRAGMGARDLFEGRNAYAAVEFGKGFSELKGAPAIIGGISAAFAAAAVAGYELVKSTAEEARELNNLAIRTGLTVEQAENLSIQAKIAGVDINSLERSAVQLSKGLEDASGAGKKQADTLREMGISTLQASGQQKEMGEVLSEVLERLSQIPDTSKRLYEAQLLLGRGAKELQPMITDLGTLKQTADQLSQSLATGANEELLKASHQISQMDVQWDLFWKNVAAKITPIVIPVIMQLNGADKTPMRPGNPPLPSSYYPKSPGGNLADVSPEQIAQGMESMRKAGAAETFRQHALSQVGTTPEALQSLLSTNNEQLQQAFSTLNQKGAEDTKVYADALRDYNNAQKERIALEQQLKAVEAGKSNSLDKYLTELKGSTSSQNVSPLQKILEERDTHQREFQDQFSYLPQGQRDAASQQIAQDFSVAFNRELNAMEQKSTLQSQKMAEDQARLQVQMNEERLSIENSIAQQNSKELVANAKAGVFSTGVPGEGVQMQLPAGMGTPPGPSSREQAELTKDMLAQESRRIELVSGPGGELAAARQIIELKKQSLAIDEQQAEAEASVINNQFDREKKIHDIRVEYARQIYDAESQYQDKLLEKQKQVAETAAGLYHTLFTDPKKFPKQLQSTLKEAALQPLTESLGNLTAKALFPGLGGGLKDVQATGGALHVLVTNFGDRTATPTSFIDSITTERPPGAPPVLAGGGGGYPGSIATMIGVTAAQQMPFSGLAMTSASARESIGTIDRTVGTSDTNSLPYFGASAPLFSGGTGASYPGAAIPVAGGSSRGGLLSTLFGHGYGMGSNPAAMIGPGGTAGFAPGSIGIPRGGTGFGGLLSIGGSGGGYNLGSIFGRGPTPGPSASDQPGWTGTAAPPPGGYDPGVDPTASTGGNWATQGVGGTAGAALGGTGMAIALHGLTGRNEGTGRGVLEGAAGGAMVGMEYGGPVGAAIGAAVGAGIGVGEMLAGVMSPWAKAAMYAKQLYGITINDNMQNQIVNIAKSSYGGDIQLAVRSPQVRQMLGLYAAGTGQSNAKAIMNSMPHSAGLSEQNGILQQDASYMYGNSYKYQSSLPTLGGNNATTTLNSPSGYPGSSSSGSPINLSLNIDGKNAGDFMAGNVVTPEFVNDQWSDSMMSSNNRVSSSALLQEPGLITS